MKVSSQNIISFTDTNILNKKYYTTRLGTTPTTTTITTPTTTATATTVYSGKPLIFRSQSYL